MTTEIFMVCEDSLVHVAVPPGDYVIGRDPESDIHINDSSVSSRHARLVVESETVCIQDLDSENGTFIEGEPAVALTNLYDGQTAVLGSVSLRVRQSTDPRALGEGPRYVRGGMVAFGGMGAIHEARQAAMGRKVAMKVMLHSWNATSVKRFLDEARITGMLEHPNIVPVHELGLDEEEQFFYTMKFVRGATLAEVIAGLALNNKESAKKFPLQVLLTIFQKVCDAVAFAHSRGVWHRDLKPENIMIGDFGEVLVMDWGLAKESGFASPDPASQEEDSPAAPESSSASAPMRTMEGMVLGTPAYMAPEQARGETSVVDHRSDIYSLGAILHEILHLQPVVRGKDRDEVVDKVAAGIRDEPEERPLLHLPGHRVPASLEAVCRKAMAFEREKRYQQVTALQADITAYQSGFATSAEGAGPGKQFLLFIKRNRGVSVAVAAGFLALLVSSVVFTVNVMRERNRAEAAEVEAKKKQKQAEDALAMAFASDAKARSSDLKAEAARDEREAMRERYVGIYGSAEKAATESAALSQEMLAAGRFDEALMHIDNAAQLMPEKTGYLMAKANLLQSSGQLREAAGTYRGMLAAGESPQVRENLELTEKLIKAQGPRKTLTADSVLVLEKALMRQQRERELVLLNAVATGQFKVRSASGSPGRSAPAGAKESLEAKFAKYKKQTGWRKDRLSQKSDGSWEVDLSGLRIDDLSMLRGENISGLSLRDTAVVNLGGLRGLRLVSLDLGGTKVQDLAPIRPMLLQDLVLDGTKVGSLDAIRGMPLKKLRVACAEITDFSPISTLRDLEELALPANAFGIDTQPLQKLRIVEHPRFRETGAMPAEEFRKISGAFEDSWSKWRKSIAACGADEVPAERITVREAPLVDLDLRGFALNSLEPLQQMPLRTLRLSSGQELDISGLAGHPTLRHLDLSGAVVGKVAPLLGNEALRSIVLSPAARDVAKASGSAHLEKLGYLADGSGAAPRPTLAEFFGPRTAPIGGSGRPAQPTGAWHFDEPSKAEAGWTSQEGTADSRPLIWRADPSAEGGRGGGYLSVADVAGELVGPDFFAPAQVLEALRGSYGGVMEFDMRAPPIARYLEGADIMIEGGGTSIHFFAQIRPDSDWQTFLVPLRQHPAWRERTPDGPLASDKTIRAVLQRPTALHIRTQHAKDGSGIRYVGFDDFVIWPASESAGRQARCDQEQLASVRWARGLEVKSKETHDMAGQQGLNPFCEGDSVFVPAYEGRRGVLTVHPIAPDKPAVITFRTSARVQEGTKLQISGRGSFVEPGVRVRVTHEGKELSTLRFGGQWRREEVELPPAGTGAAAYQIEVWPDGWDMEDAYFDDISLLLPDGTREFCAAPPSLKSPRFPQAMEELDGPWLWDEPGWRTALFFRDGKLPGHDWKFQLEGQRLLVLIGASRSVELRQSENGNWHGIQQPEKCPVRMERIASNGQTGSGPLRSLSELNGNWIFDYGQGFHVVNFKRGKPQSPFSGWKLRMEDGIINVETVPGNVTDLVPQEDASWLGFESKTGYIIKFFRQK